MQSSIKSLCALLLVSASFFLVTSSIAQQVDAKPRLKIIKDELMQEGHSYVVKGSIYNPHPQPVRNVVIRYYVWKKFLGREGFGSFIKDTGGMVQATIRYVPPRTSVDFLAGGGKAPIQLNVLPDPLGPPDIAAEWDD